MIRDLADLLMHLIQNLNAAEDQMMQAMPAIIEKVHHSSLKNALTHHLNLTTEQKKRLEQVTRLLNQKNIEKPVALNPEHICKGMMGLIGEANDLLQTGLEKDVTDAAIIACVQKMEHYEISTYGTALAYAHQLHLSKAEELLNETLNEEYEVDDLLTALATASLNKEAIHQHIENVDPANSDTSAEDNESSESTAQVHITERTINSPSGGAATSHCGYGSGESKGH